MAMLGLLCASLGLYSIAVAAPMAAGLLLLTRCINGRVARGSVDWSILIVIGAGLGIATAMDKTGAAGAVARVVAGQVVDGYEFELWSGAHDGGLSGRGFQMSQPRHWELHRSVIVRCTSGTDRGRRPTWRARPSCGCG